MSIFKKFAAPLVAVALVAVMGVSLLGSTRVAYAAVATDPTVTGTLTGTVWNSSAIPTKLPTTLVLTEPSAAAWTAAETITITHTALTATACVTTGPVTSCTGGAGSTVIVLSAGVTTGIDTVTITSVTIRVTANSAPTTFPVTIGAGAIAGGTITSSRLNMGWNTSTSTPAVIDRTTPSFEADTTAAGGALCAFIADAAGAVTISLPLTFTVSLGVVSTGSSKTSSSLTSSSGSACTNYRGGGGTSTTDTAIVSSSSANQVSTLSITLTSPTGNTASKMIIQQPTVLAVSPTINNVSPGFISPTTSTNFAVQVQDSSGLGVNGQVVLITVDKGALVAGFGAACGTAKAVTGTSATGTLTTASTDNKAGVIAMTYCGNQTDAAGQATITAQNISTSMSNVTTTISTADRPGTVDATYANGSISVKVTDAAGNLVADGTPVQFTISSNAGAVSNACTTTTNGVASSAVSLNGPSGTVIVTASWNETGTAAACTAAGGTTGAQTTSTVVNIGGATTPGGTSTGAGGFASAPVFSASKLAQSVFNGGSVAQLETAVTAGGGTGVWAQDANGVFVLDIINGGFVNGGFNAAFPSGFAGVTAVTVVGQ